MMTATRHDRVQVALNALLPDQVTWIERCEPKWLEAFPAGIAPRFTYTKTVDVCPDRIVEVGASLEDYDFESLLDALIVWVVLSQIDLQSDVAPETVIDRFAEAEPVEAMVLSAAADERGLTLMEFLGVNRRDAA
jgi:hypothetical protein